MHALEIVALLHPTHRGLAPFDGAARQDSLQLGGDLIGADDGEDDRRIRAGNAAAGHST